MKESLYSMKYMAKFIKENEEELSESESEAIEAVNITESEI